MPFRFCDLLSGHFDPALQSEIDQVRDFPEHLVHCLLIGPPRRQPLSKAHLIWPTAQREALKLLFSAVGKQLSCCIMLTEWQVKARQ